MKLERKKMMANMGFPETEEGFRDALDFIIAEFNDAGLRLKAPKELRDAWHSAIPNMVLRTMEFCEKGYTESCYIVDLQTGKKEGATKKRMDRLMDKESLPGGATYGQMRASIEKNREAFAELVKTEKDEPRPVSELELYDRRVRENPFRENPELKATYLKLKAIYETSEK